MLEIENSECITEDYMNDYNIGDGINESWYELVDEDIQSYLNNTLIFYNKNDLPQSE